MPLTTKGEKIEKAMVKKYGEKRGKEVFYASRNAGTITGVDTFKARGQSIGSNDFVPGGRTRR